MAEVIRWSTGEDMMNTKLERETQASVSRCFAQLSSFRMHMLVYRTALIYSGMDGPEWESTTGVLKKNPKKQALLQRVIYFRSAGDSVVDR